jgi:hypothetical protein
MSVMISRTYINEVDIRKIVKGQQVEIGLDAFPEKKLTGEVIKVANVGEQRPNSDAKVFQVDIQLNETDDLIKPAMTTSNRIVTAASSESLFIPLECLNNQYDSITYVFKKDGLSTIKQEVMIGNTNINEVVILSGLEEGDQLYLSKVEGMDDDEIVLNPDMDGKRNPASGDSKLTAEAQTLPTGSDK